MGETLAGLLSREASPSSILAWEEVSTGRGGASDLWDGDGTASTIVAFPLGGAPTHGWTHLPLPGLVGHQLL